MDTPMNLLKITFLLALTLTCILGAPASDKSVEQDNENNSKILNEVGPSQEDWKLFEQLSKAKAIDSNNDPEKIKKLFKEIEEFSQQAQTTYMPNDSTGESSKEETVPRDSETGSSDWFDSLWKEITGRSGRDNDGDNDSKEDITTTESSTDVPLSEQNEDNDPVEDIVKKLSDDLKKLYRKLKEVIKVVKNWVVHREEGDKTSEMTGSATEQDGVFLTAPDPIIGDKDKSNKYVLPINTE